MSIPLPPQADIQQHVRAALLEDVGSGDITAQLIPENKQIKAKIIARESGILCGCAWVDEVFEQLGGDVVLHWLTHDGDRLVAGDCLVELTGNARHIMTGERCALNFLQTLSATATQTAELAKLIRHTRAELLDTRKTLPGLRSAQKYAVRVGGGSNHRMGLYDAYLIKENHIAACGSIANAVATAHHLEPGKPVEVEVRNLDELQEAISAQADTIMLDNFSLSDLQAAVTITAQRCQLEASGGVGRDTLVKIAETGVDCISIGALTKHCQAIDLSLLIE